jgi:hypothetical protein
VARLTPPPAALPSRNRITEDRFLAGFVAALRSVGVEFVDTDEDSHHGRFDSAMEVVRDRQKAGDPGAGAMPRTLMPTPMTGRYRELDDTLLDMQRGHLSAPNPFYPGIRLKLSQERADKILGRFSEDQRAVLLAMAEVFRDAP